MSEIVERVARAIEKALAAVDIPMGGPTSGQIARAAIAAMREPSRDMELAPNFIEIDRGDLGKFYLTRYEAHDIFVAMIDGALK